MALDDLYATLDELRSRVGITSPDDTTDDVKMTNALTASSRGIERTCGRVFNDAGSASARVYYRDTRCLVRVDDFSTTTGLIVETDQDDDGTYETTWSSADYQLEPLNGVVDGQPGWPFYRIRAVGAGPFPRRGRRPSVRVTARWGWTAVPSPVHEVCLIVSEELTKLKDAPFGIAGYGDYGAVRVRQNPIAMGML
ncbi:MAG: hypothetical protein ACRDQ1_08980, partial [Sciscionella sp.]